MIPLSEIKVMRGLKTLITECVFYATLGIPFATWLDKEEKGTMRDKEGQGLCSTLFAEFKIRTRKGLSGCGNL